MPHSKKRKVAHNQSISFKSYYDELAEIGELQGFVENHLQDEVNANPDLKNRVIDSLYQNSKTHSPQVEQYILENLCEALSFFNQYTALCRLDTQNPSLLK